MDASEDSFGEEGAIRFYDVEDLPAQTHRQSFSENILREESRDSLNSNDDLASQAAKSTEFASKSTEFASKSTESPANSNVDSKEPGDDFDPRFLIRNLDTDEKFHVAELDTKFPGLLTLDTFVEAKKSWSPDVKAAQEDAAEQEMDLEQDEEHLRKKESAGWFKKLFGRRSSISKDPTENNRVQIKLHKKVQSDFNPLKVIQQMSLNSGPIWALKLSPDGNYLAAAGSDAVVRIWTVAGSPAHIEFIEQLARKDQEAASNSSEQSMPPLSSRFARKVSLSERAQNEASTEIPHESNDQKEIPEKLGGRQVIFPEVFREFRGHSSDIVDLSWSPANFLLSASLDKTVRLWHVSKDKCLCKFQHADFVTSVMFHPTSMKLFLSGSYDRILRVWNILDHRVESWAQVDAVITSASYSPDGKLAVAGLASGQCVFYRSDGLNYFTQIDCKNRHGKHSVGRKVTGLQFFRDCKHVRSLIFHLFCCS